MALSTRRSTSSFASASPSRSSSRRALRGGARALLAGGGDRADLVRARRARGDGRRHCCASGAPYRQRSISRARNPSSSSRSAVPALLDAVDFAPADARGARACARRARHPSRPQVRQPVLRNKVRGRTPDHRFLDFGVAMTIDGHDDNRIVGSPAYMSPEQLCRGAVDARARTSGRSASCSTRCSPASCPSRARSRRTVPGVLNTTPVPLNEKNAAIPRAAAVVQRCLTRDVERRWNSARPRVRSRFSRRAPPPMSCRASSARSRTSHRSASAAASRRWRPRSGLLDEHVQEAQAERVSTVPPAAMGLGDRCPQPASALSASRCSTRVRQPARAVGPADASPASRSARSTSEEVRSNPRGGSPTSCSWRRDAPRPQDQGPLRARPGGGGLEPPRRPAGRRWRRKTAPTRPFARPTTGRYARRVRPQPSAR